MDGRSDEAWEGGLGRLYLYYTNIPYVLNIRPSFISNLLYEEMRGHLIIASKVKFFTKTHLQHQYYKVPNIC
jgi:hypothetical protein